ncbi:hypothetical protein F1735_16750 [Massilia sp. CCM 8694]|uniref:Uncharacterized protein n=1 Tax=Massilia genomosp. 1 TaxID=2609280 RepID=A0ABX0MV71_9BURK|nr:hypothetical protein [Massilia genomosp. 1]
MDSTTIFVHSARDFCQWAEGDLQPGEAQVPIARRHLARLYAQALDLPQRDGDWGDEAAQVSHAAWQSMFARFGALPLNYLFAERQSGPESGPRPGAHYGASCSRIAWPALMRSGIG